MKIDKNLVFGAIALIITVICGIFSLKGGIGAILLSTLFYIVAVAAVLLLYSYFLPQTIGVGADWLYYAPFAIMLVLSRAFLGWDLFMPFYTAGFIAVTLDIFARRKGKLKNETLIIAGSGFASVAVFALISLCGGVVL